MFINAKEMLQKAVKGQYAVAQINILNLEWVKATLATAEECKSPVILGVAPLAATYMGGYSTASAMAIAMGKSLDITVPVALHLDHGSYNDCITCAEVGYTSIMFDGSNLPFEENIKKTKEIVDLARARGMSIEAEIGSIGGEEDGKVGYGDIACPDECKAIADLGIDFLAAGIGNIHGVYPSDWPGLDFATLEKIAKTVSGMPLVLHGGSGIPNDMIKKAISLGVAKINVNTECQLSFTAATRAYIEEGHDLIGKGFDPRNLLAPGYKAIKNTMREKFELFGSVGKA